MKIHAPLRVATSRSGLRADFPARAFLDAALPDAVFAGDLRFADDLRFAGGLRFVDLRVPAIVMSLSVLPCSICQVPARDSARNRRSR